MMHLLILRYILYAGCIISNSYLIHALRKLKKLRKLSYRFVLYLSISDVCFGISGMLMDSISLYGSKCKCIKVPDPLVWLIAGHNFCSNFSLGCVLIIAIDRFLHMKFLTRYETMMTKRRARMLLMINTVFTTQTITVMSILPYYEKRFIIKHYETYRIYRIVLSFFYIALISSIFVVYIWTYLTIRKRVANLTSIQGRGMVPETAQSRKETEEIVPERPRPGKVRNNHQGKIPASSTSRTRRSPDQEFARGMVYIVLSLVICSLPNLCIPVSQWLISVYGSNKLFAKTMELTEKMQRWTYLMLILNGALNAIFLIAFCRELRKFTRRNIVNLFSEGEGNGGQRIVEDSRRDRTNETSTL